MTAPGWTRVACWWLLTCILMSGVFPGWTLHAQEQGQTQVTPLFAALSRLPADEQGWETLAYSDYAATMSALDETWPPESDTLTEGQALIWESLWRPDLFAQDVSPYGLNIYHVEKAAEARRAGAFVLWLEGAFNLPALSDALLETAYQPLTGILAEAYQATARPWSEIAPFMAVPDGRTLLIASSEEGLAALVAVYDGQAPALIGQDDLLAALAEVTPALGSAVLRLQPAPEGCPLSAGAATLHGIRYQEGWEYVLSVGFRPPTILTNERTLADGLEFSTYPLQDGGVLGQHTRILTQTQHEASGGNILQFSLSVVSPRLPMQAASEPDVCHLFEAPPAAALALAIGYVPDVSAGGLNLTLRYGNTEQALYNAGYTAGELSSRQQAALNSTWRSDMAFESDFAAWFSFSPEAIRQAVDISLPDGSYVRVLWGDFTRDAVEEALETTGYIPLEQYAGVRVFELRNAPQSGGVLLSSLMASAAIPGDGVLVFADSLTNTRLALDVILGRTRSLLTRQREVVLLARALGDATNITLQRYTTPRLNDLICGLPAYKTQAFANVLRPDGWHLLYAVSFVGGIANAEATLNALVEVLEDSDYALQGPGSATLGALASVVDRQVIQENDVTVLLVDMLVNAPDQQASFIGQEIAGNSLLPCALGDMMQ